LPDFMCRVRQPRGWRDEAVVVDSDGADRRTIEWSASPASSPAVPLAVVETDNPAVTPADTLGTRLLPQLDSLWSALRWSALLVAFALAVVVKPTPALAAWGFVIAGWALLQTLRPTDYERGGWLVVGALLLEVLIGAAAVEFTGLEHSPYLVCLAVATLLAGYAGGLRIVPGLVAIACMSVVIPTVVQSPGRAYVAQAAEFATLLLLVAVVGGQGRRLLENAGRVGEGLVGQVEQLSEVNSLLLDLHAATKRVSMPLELEGALGWVVDRAEQAFAPDAAAVFLRDPGTGTWRVAAAKGLHDLDADETLQLPACVAAATAKAGPRMLGDDEEGLEPASVWGLYCALRARDEVLGVVAVETLAERVTTPADERRLSGLASAAALAIDNARWMGRIRAFGVEQERARIARDLHDHVGQSMAYLGLELDRLVKLNFGRAVQKELQVLRGHVQALVQELRDTLVDLRTDVSVETDVADVIASLAGRVQRRSGIEVSCSFDAQRRLPLSIEREIWRIAQEAMLNAERHSRASRIEVTWISHESAALLEVADDGIGMSLGTSGCQERYGLVGMRERADSISGRLDVRSSAGNGTTVSLRMEVAGRCAS
jgi:signal transduction histidine kinase